MTYENEAALVVSTGLNPKHLKRELERKGVTAPEICVYYETDSTNREARAYHDMHREGEAVFIADGQTAGRGRRGRSFCSPHGAGIYMSFLLHPKGELRDLTSVTTYAAVAVCRAIERACGLRTDIKWVNDIYYKGKKLGGILTEGALSEDMKTASYVIVGIGLNLARCDFPDEIAEIATSIEEITGSAPERNLLLTEIMAELLSGLDGISSDETLEEYRRRSFLVGREITVHKLTASYPARVIGIGEDTSLLIRLTDGSVEKLITGEVSVRER